MQATTDIEKKALAMRIALEIRYRTLAQIIDRSSDPVRVRRAVNALAFVAEQLATLNELLEV